ncbi:hypothetical protein B0H66DRAFT_180439 [Apodospora peruviana]|uniref:Uncharacterized protein n=1 Tax=Apodospora peruviana TaxID=516989 RepID=A0AAE0IB67_9PEZI|nr:hypothetical protein B0H66DRAFT_180439 [Apodospora peruviana]
MSCGAPIYDVPKASGSGVPSPINRRPQDVAARRPTFFNETLHFASYKVQNPDTWTFREIVFALWGIYAFVWRGYWTTSSVYSLLFREPMSRACYNHSFVSCVATQMWRLVANILFMGWGSRVMPWALVAGLIVFFGEEVGRWRRTSAKGKGKAF